MFKENYIIKGQIRCVTGLHIGGSNDSVEIGGSDNVVIRNAVDNQPFIPGSSLKGKLRSIIELNDEVFVKNLIAEKKGEKISDVRSDIAVKIFGGSAEENTSKFPTRLIVRDAFPTEETVKMWEKYNDVIDGAELKYENNINRLDSKATPRNIERVPKKSEFEFEIVFSVYDEDEEDVKTTLPELINAMLLLEDSYLGGSGSRGFGQIEFNEIKIFKRDQTFYKENKDEILFAEGNNILKLRKELFEKLII